ncbi:hypothetical protein D5E75_22735, partial [Vibrio parahaemolyticus]
MPAPNTTNTSNLILNSVSSPIKKRFIADKRELKTKTVVSDRVLSPNKTYTNYRFHVESYFPIFIL